MYFWRVAGLLLMVLWGLSWFVPPWGWSLPFFTALFWVYGGGAFFTVGLLSDNRHRWFWLAGLLVWIGSLRYIWSFFPSISHETPFLRIATFNMDAAHYRRPQIERLADSLRRWHPDILCLQEVYLGDYTVEAFARRVGYTHYTFLDAKMHMGMLILSDFPIEKDRIHLLLPGTTNGLHEARLRLPDGEVAQVIHIHFPSYRLGREDSWSWNWLSRIWGYHAKFYKNLYHLLEKPSTMVWVCGDFNAPPFHPIYRMLNRLLYDSHTAAPWGVGPTWQRVLRIDYIWGSHPALWQRIRWIPGQAHAYVEAAYALSTKSATFVSSGR
ncbi:MAG: endonuclease/exonuclease/phosphatase family protein [Bacteroidia bacterium]|nr:endonuclease/exonuclease/phosphatase family protein [Bacteroidia bacterium]